MSLHADRLTVVLADGQQNADIFNHLPYDGHLLAPAKSPVAKSPATLSSSPSSYPAFSASSAYSSYSAYPASSAHPASPSPGASSMQAVTSVEAPTCAPFTS